MYSPTVVTVLCIYTLSVSSAPEVAPVNLRNEVIFDEEPFQFEFTWQLPHSGSNSIQAPVHSGFIIQCYENSTNISSTYIPTPPIVSHTVFTEESQASTALTFPGTCASESTVFFCNAQSFNEMGEGPSGELSVLFLPCNTVQG